MNKDDRIAEPTAVYGADTADESTAVTVNADRVNGRFGPGNTYGKGRPRKGESVPERLKRKVEAKGDAVVDAVIARLLRQDSVGNRAFADVRDTIYGVPKQHLVLSQGEDDPLLGLFTVRELDVSHEANDAKD